MNTTTPSCSWTAPDEERGGRWICIGDEDAIAHRHSSACPPDHAPWWACHPFTLEVDPTLDAGCDFGWRGVLCSLPAGHEGLHEIVMPAGAPVEAHVNTGAAHDRAMAWSEGHTAGFEEGVAEAARLREALDKIPSRVWSHAYHELRHAGQDEQTAMARADLIRIETERSIRDILALTPTATPAPAAAPTGTRSSGPSGWTYVYERDLATGEVRVVYYGPTPAATADATPAPAPDPVERCAYPMWADTVTCDLPDGHAGMHEHHAPVERSSGVHNHGLDPSCRESVVDGTLRGECLR